MVLSQRANLVYLLLTLYERGWEWCLCLHVREAKYYITYGKPSFVLM